MLKLNYFLVHMAYCGYGTWSVFPLPNAISWVMWSFPRKCHGPNFRRLCQSCHYVVLAGSIQCHLVMIRSILEPCGHYWINPRAMWSLLDKFQSHVDITGSITEPCGHYWIYYGATWSDWVISSLLVMRKLCHWRLVSKCNMCMH